MNAQVDEASLQNAKNQRKNKAVEYEKQPELPGEVACCQSQSVLGILGCRHCNECSQKSKFEGDCDSIEHQKFL